MSTTPHQHAFTLLVSFHRTTHGLLGPGVNAVLACANADPEPCTERFTKRYRTTDQLREEFGVLPDRA